jgi:hypothetical protein
VAEFFHVSDLGDTSNEIPEQFQQEFAAQSKASSIVQLPTAQLCNNIMLAKYHLILKNSLSIFLSHISLN